MHLKYVFTVFHSESPCPTIRYITAKKNVRMHTLHYAVHILSLLPRISPAEPHNNHLWFIIQPDIDRVGPKSPSDDHPALFSSFSRKFKISRAARIKKLVLGCHDSAQCPESVRSAPHAAYSSKNSGEWARRRQNFSGSGSPRVSFKRPSGISPDRGR